MNQNTQKFFEQLGRAVLLTAVIAVAQPAEAESLPSNDWLDQVSAFPVPEEQQTQAIQRFYTLQTDLTVLEQAMQASGLPLNQLTIETVLPVTWPDSCLGIYEPNRLCQMIPVGGWVAVVSDGERSWVYHTTTGRARLNSALSDEAISLFPLPEIDWPALCWDDKSCLEQRLVSGLTQETPVMPERNDAGTWIFEDAPTGRWFNSLITPGLTYTIAGDGYFSDILDFPTDIDADNQFTVTVANQVLGQFSPGERVNFFDVLGSGVKEFTISDIDPHFALKDPLAFPLKLGFTTPVVSGFTMTPLSKTESVPEPSVLLGSILLGTAGWKLQKRAV